MISGKRVLVCVLVIMVLAVMFINAQTLIIDGQPADSAKSEKQMNKEDKKELDRKSVV